MENNLKLITFILDIVKYDWMMSIKILGFQM